MWSAQSGIAWRIEIRKSVSEEEGGGSGEFEEEWILKERVLGLELKMEGRVVVVVECGLRKVFGVKLEEREILEMGLIGFVAVCVICGS